MNRRQKIIVSVTGIVIITLALLGLTFAYFLTRIQGNEETKSISVTTANLELVYGNDDGSIIGEGEEIIPGTTFEEKTFTVTNKGNSKIDNYAVILEDVKTFYARDYLNESNETIPAGTQVEFERAKDFELVITCTKKDGTSCNGMNGTLPLMRNTLNSDHYFITNGILVTNSIEVGDVHTYSAVLIYKNVRADQSADMNKKLEGKFNIIDANNTADITGTVEDYSQGDIVQINSIPRTSQINSDGSYKIVGLESGIHSIKLVGETTTEISKLSIIKGQEEGFGETTIDGVTIPQITITNSTSSVNVNIKDSRIELVEPEKMITFKLPYPVADPWYTEYFVKEGTTWREFIDSPVSKGRFIYEEPYIKVNNSEDPLIGCKVAKDNIYDDVGNWIDMEYPSINDPILEHFYTWYCA